MPEESLKEWVRRIKLNEITVDERIHALLNATIEDISKWHVDEIQTASIAIARHAFVLRLEVNRVMSLIYNARFEMNKAVTDEEVAEWNTKLTRLNMQKEFLYGVPDSLMKYADTLKAMVYNKSREMNNYKKMEG